MNKFIRSEALIGIENNNKLRDLSILVVGLGGVGSSCLETLARFGINDLTIVDFDIIDESNINRQIIATSKNIGKSKVDEWEERTHTINIDCHVTKFNLFLDKSNCNEIFWKNFNYVVDCIDSVEAKIELYRICLEKHIKIISSMGTATKLDPSKLVITTLNKTSDDRLAKKMRLLCRDNNIDAKEINVVYSKEEPLTNITKPLPSMAPVPNCAGIYCAYFILNDFLKNQ